MRRWNLSHYAIRSCVTVALLAGCGEPQPSIGLPGAMPQSRPIALHGQVPKELIYVIYPRYGFIAMYSASGKFYQRKLIARLDQPQAACVGRNDHVFVTLAGASSIAEFDSGRAKQIGTLSDPGEYPAACAVDPTSGRIAVTNYLAAGGGRGSVSIYENASSTSKIYIDKRIYAYQFCAYDSKGNLFIDGLHTLKSGFEFAELPHGGNHFENLNLGAEIKFAGALLWDGKDIALADPKAKAIDRIADGHIVAQVRLDHYLGSDFFIANGEIGTVMPLTRGPMQFWKYPKGGKLARPFLLNLQPDDIPIFVAATE